MLCEYPAWGALSRQPSNEYTQFVAAIEGFLVEDELSKKRKTILVAPSEDEMDKRIELYSKDYEEQTQQNEAKKANRNLINALKGLEGTMPKSFKHWPVDEVPRYQMLLIGQDVGNQLRPLEAIFWVAPRSSRENSSSQTPEIGPEAALKNKKGETEREVPVFAWQTTDPNLLRPLYESAYHYATLAKIGAPTNYEEFLLY